MLQAPSRARARLPGVGPMTARDLIAKFRDCAEPVLGPAGATQLLDRLQRCLELADIREMTIATVPAHNSLERSKLGNVPAGSSRW